MNNLINTSENIKKEFDGLKDFLNEFVLRRWCAFKAKAIGRGGILLVHQATGISRPTIIKAIKELNEGIKPEKNRVRKKAGGSKKLVDKDKSIIKHVEELVTTSTMGDPEKPLLWCSKSTYHIATELKKQGHTISQRSVYNILSQQGYSLKYNRKIKEGTQNNPDRDQQFHFINQQVIKFQEMNCPVLSIDTKKKENIGEFKNNGRECHKKGDTTNVNVYDFIDKKKGKQFLMGFTT